MLYIFSWCTHQHVMHTDGCKNVSFWKNNNNWIFSLVCVVFCVLWLFASQHINMQQLLKIIESNCNYLNSAVVHEDIILNKCCACCVTRSLHWSLIIEWYYCKHTLFVKICSCCWTCFCSTMFASCRCNNTLLWNSFFHILQTIYLTYNMV